MRSPAVRRPRPSRAPDAPIRRPARLTSLPGARAASIRPSTASITWSATVRPKRASHAAGTGSELVMVPVASPRLMVTVLDASSHSSALLILTSTVSPPSSIASSRMRTNSVHSVTPGGCHSVDLGRCR